MASYPSTSNSQMRLLQHSTCGLVDACRIFTLRTTTFELLGLSVSIRSMHQVTACRLADMLPTLDSDATNPFIHHVTVM